jgi:hypothetical protein
MSPQRTRQNLNFCAKNRMRSNNFANNSSFAQRVCNLVKYLNSLRAFNTESLGGVLTGVLSRKVVLSTLGGVLSTLWAAPGPLGPLGPPPKIRMRGVILGTCGDRTSVQGAFKEQQEPCCLPATRPLRPALHRNARTCGSLLTRVGLLPLARRMRGGASCVVDSLGCCARVKAQCNVVRHCQ